ncbi:AI-2E family transporter [Halobacillus sp. Marseille-Q1614]|uniref:AI-2E family transporter n=1 Tax=Halobacillus sp. Marseille-Q1614 TaxID=2709134 RepID=UPI001570972A|nr:AI-2E family transporter [Halobacillus sp. Marseille-Q1614]
MIHKRWFQVLVSGILLCLLILLLHEISFFFKPFLTYAAAIAFPLIGGAILFYISRPLMHLLEHYKVPRLASILVIFLVFILAGFLVVQFIAPIAQQQFSRLVENIPRMGEMITETITYWQQNQDIIPDQFNSALENVVQTLQDSLDAAPGVIINVVSQLVGFVFGLVLIPFFLFFMLKDGHKLVPFLKQFMNLRVAGSFDRLAKSLDHTLHSFIIGQLIVSVFVGLILLVGYLIIGLEYSLTLALFAMLMNVIPFVGPFLAVIPAILVALFQEPIMAVYVAIIMIIAQQLEGNLVSPNVMGKALNIHPLTIITVILAAGSLAGFLGLLFAIPAYAVIKTIISHFYQEWLDNRKAAHD